jgi:hypothetical protein
MNVALGECTVYPRDPAWLEKVAGHSEICLFATNDEEYVAAAESIWRIKPSVRVFAALTPPVTDKSFLTEITGASIQVLAQRAKRIKEGETNEAFPLHVPRAIAEAWLAHW